MFDFIINENDIISGEKFSNLSDNIVCYYNVKNKITKTFLYSDTYCYQSVLDYVENNSDKFFKIIFHNSVFTCPTEVPKNCVIFSDNVSLNNKCYNVFSIPLGLENTKWFKHINKNKKILNAKQKIPSKLCYCNFNVATNKEIREHAKQFTNKSYFTKDMHHNGYNFDSYLNNILDHFYIFSPPGRGLDCHRTWETLYLKRVPIIYNVYKKDLFEDLPVLIINNPEELTEEFLIENKKIILNKKYNFEKLKFYYWKEKIINIKKEKYESLDVE